MANPALPAIGPRPGGWEPLLHGIELSFKFCNKNSIPKRTAWRPQGPSSEVPDEDRKRKWCVFLSPRHLLQAMGVTLQVFSARSTSEVHGEIPEHGGNVGGGAAQRENQSPPQRQGITTAIIEWESYAIQDEGTWKERDCSIMLEHGGQSVVHQGEWREMLFFFISFYFSCANNTIYW